MEPPKRNYFPKVKLARELLQSKAAEIIEMYLANAKQLAEQGAPDKANADLWRLIHHMPVGEGEAVIDGGAQKQLPEAPKGPAIAIGIQLGGMREQKELIEITPTPSPTTRHEEDEQLPRYVIESDERKAGE